MFITRLRSKLAGGVVEKIARERAGDQAGAPINQMRVMQAGAGIDAEDVFRVNRRIACATGSRSTGAMRSTL